MCQQGGPLFLTLKIPVLYQFKPHLAPENIFEQEDRAEPLQA